MDDDRQAQFTRDFARDRYTTSAPVSPAVDSAANALLLRYSNAASFFFATPRRTLLGSGLRARVAASPGCDSAALRAVFDQARDDGAATPLIVGALAFDSEVAPVLFVPRTVERAGALRHVELPAPRAAAQRCVTHEKPSAAAYAAHVERALQRMRSSSLKKVVLARALEIASESDIDQAQLLRNLARRNPAGFTFAVDLPVATRGCAPRRLMGASPELLVERQGLQVLANPIAGSVPRCADAAEDAARGKALLTSAKDLHEHDLVVDAVLDALRPYCRWIECPTAPSLISTATLWHLSTRVVGELRDPATTSLDLAQALHPTPAVCGQPRQLARDTIREIEPFCRGLFTGMVGWCDAQGDGEWAVTIRCAEVQAGRARLYAGAGIVPASEPLLEVAETGAKFCAMLDALGVGAAP